MNLKQCGGWRRYGGIFTLGPVKWEHCKEKPLVLLKFENDHGKAQILPACMHCWNECKANGVKILSVEPIKEEGNNA